MCKYVLISPHHYKPVEQIFTVEIKGYTYEGSVRSISYCYSEKAFQEIASELKDLTINHTGYGDMLHFDYRSSKLHIPQCNTLSQVLITCINTDGQSYDVKFA